MSHTILLIQAGTCPQTRTYSDYDNVAACMEGICKIYEEHLKDRNPNSALITYDVAQLFEFIDQLNDISCLVYLTPPDTYAPFNKEWIKSKIYELLTHEASRSKKPAFLTAEEGT